MRKAVLAIAVVVMGVGLVKAPAGAAGALDPRLFGAPSLGFEYQSIGFIPFRGACSEGSHRYFCAYQALRYGS